MVTPGPDWALVSGRILADPGLWCSQRASAPATGLYISPDRSSSQSSLDGEHLRADSKIHGCLASPCPPPDESEPDDIALDRSEEVRPATRQAETSTIWSHSGSGLIATTWAKSWLQSINVIRTEFPLGDKRESSRYCRRQCAVADIILLTATVANVHWVPIICLACYSGLCEDYFISPHNALRR